MLLFMFLVNMLLVKNNSPGISVFPGYLTIPGYAYEEKVVRIA